MRVRIDQPRRDQSPLRVERRRPFIARAQVCVIPDRHDRPLVNRDRGVFEQAQLAEARATLRPALLRRNPTKLTDIVHQQIDLLLHGPVVQSPGPAWV